MTTSVPDLVVVLLCIIGAGALVTAFAAFGKSMFSQDQTEVNFNQRSPEQDSYLRRVREINQMSIWGSARSQRKEERRLREQAASDIEIQSGMSYSNAGMHSSHGPSYQGQGYGGGPVTYYEGDYAGQENANAGYEEQQRPHHSSHGNPYMNNQPKHGPTETWNEVQR